MFTYYYFLVKRGNYDVGLTSVVPILIGKARRSEAQVDTGTEKTDC